MAQLAAAQGLSEAEAEGLKALVALQAPQLINDFKADLAGTEEIVLTLSVDGDRLTLTDADGDARGFSEGTPSSAVEALTWGQVKGALR